MLGKRVQGRPRIGMLNELIEKYTYIAMKPRAEIRSEWIFWTPNL